MDNLQQGIAALRVGQKVEARKLLIAAVKQSPDSERAWGWLHNASKNDQERIHCLKQILRLNPGNEKANQLLLQLTNAGRSAWQPNTQKTKPAQARQPINKAEKRNFPAWAKLVFGGIAGIACLASLWFAVLIFSSPLANPDLGNTNPALSNIQISPPTLAPLPTTIADETQPAPTAALTPTRAPANTFTPYPTAELIPVLPQVSRAVVAPSASGTLRFHFVNVGQGDATVIQTPNGQTILIDGGETNTGIVQYLQGLGVKRIDLMIATHPHSDHIGGLVQVLVAFPVTKVVTSGDPHTTSTYEHFLDGIFSAKAEYVEVKRGEVISLDGITFHVLNPLSNSNPDLNENSVVLQFSFGTTSFMLMGDSGADTESALLASGLASKTTILKVGHHGSTSGSTRAFLSEISPQVALYSAGIGNSYHHPAPGTIAALAAVGATVYGTDQNGTISIEVTSSGYTVHAGGSAAAQATAASPIIVPPGSSSGGLEITSVTSPVAKGGNVTLLARAAPGAACTITVYYKSGPSSASGLGPKSADASGAVSWTWKVGAKTTAGNWRIVVDCNGITQETTFEVR